MVKGPFLEHQLFPLILLFLRLEMQVKKQKKNNSLGLNPEDLMPKLNLKSILIENLGLELIII